MSITNWLQLQWADMLVLGIKRPYYFLSFIKCLTIVACSDAYKMESFCGPFLNLYYTKVAQVEVTCKWCYAYFNKHMFVSTTKEWESYRMWSCNFAWFRLVRLWSYGENWSIGYLCKGPVAKLNIDDTSSCKMRISIYSWKTAFSQAYLMEIESPC